MAGQLYYRVNLSDAQIPLVSTFQGKTVIQPQLDQNYQPAPALSSEERDKGIPEALYMHNVMPSLYGYKSVAYDKVINAVAGITGSFIRIYELKDFAGNRGHLGITDAGKTYMITAASQTWTDCTPIGQPSTAKVTVAEATGTSFVCYDSFNIFTANLSAKTLSVASIQWDSPLTNASIRGISSSNNYLLAYTADTLYWSSSLDVLDFRASQITGAGKGTPTGIKGEIIAAAPVGIGYAVYCQGSIVVATFSGNVQYPWLFKEAPGGSGIISPYHISAKGDDASNYAWTSAGLLKVTLAGCAAVHPEVSDFLAGRLMEDYDYATDTLNTISLNAAMAISVSYIDSRYLVISYGPSSLSYALVYDTGLKRWGKLKLNHAQAFGISFRASVSSSVYKTFTDSMPATFLSMYPTAFNGTTVTYSSEAPEARHGLSFIQADGSVQLANFDYLNHNGESVVILGKYQMIRNKLLAIQEFTVETIESDNSNFIVRVLTSLDGKNFDVIKTPYEIVDQNIRNYYCTSIGTNHSFRFKGAFHLVGMVLVFTIDSNR